MLKEHATRFYLEDNCNCAEALLLAANMEYGLGLPDDAVKLVGGFGGGTGCGSACGALLGAVSALGAVRMGRRAHETEGFREACGDMARDFADRLGGLDCSVLKPIHAVEGKRCLQIVLAACDVLESRLAAAGREERDILT